MTGKNGKSVRMSPSMRARDHEALAGADVGDGQRMRGTPIPNAETDGRAVVAGEMAAEQGHARRSRRRIASLRARGARRLPSATTVSTMPSGLGTHRGQVVHVGEHRGDAGAEGIGGDERRPQRLAAGDDVGARERHPPHRRRRGPPQPVTRPEDIAHQLDRRLAEQAGMLPHPRSQGCEFVARSRDVHSGRRGNARRRPDLVGGIARLLRRGRSGLSDHHSAVYYPMHGEGLSEPAGASGQAPATGRRMCSTRGCPRRRQRRCSTRPASSSTSGSSGGHARTSTAGLERKLALLARHGVQAAWRHAAEIAWSQAASRSVCAGRATPGAACRSLAGVMPMPLAEKAG